MKTAYPWILLLLISSWSAVFILATLSDTVTLFSALLFIVSGWLTLRAIFDYLKRENERD